MTNFEFDNHNWKKGCKVVWKGEEIGVEAIDFVDRLIYLKRINWIPIYYISLPSNELKTDGKFLDGDAC